MDMDCEDHPRHAAGNHHDVTTTINRKATRASQGVFSVAFFVGRTTVIDLEKEKLISLAEASQMLPPGRRGKKPTLSCLIRWILKGVETGAGKVRLEACRLGCRWLTSAQAVRRFIQACTAAMEPSEPTRLAEREAARAGEMLAAKFGI